MSERSKDTILTGSIFSLLGYLQGVDIFVNKMLNSHIRPMRDRTRNFCATKCLIGHLVMMRMI